MASIRRTLSPYHDRSSHQNGGSNNNAFTLNSPSHKLNSNGKFPSPLSTFGVGVRRFKGYRTWRRSIFSCLLFFLVGFLLGLAPFGEVEDVKRRDFSFEVKPRPPIVDVKENVGGVGRPEDMVVKEGLENSVDGLGGPEDMVVKEVELGVERRENVKERFDFVARKQLIVVTPTYNRALQGYYLNRLGQVLRLVPPPILWIVVEMNAASTETADILREMGIMYRHLVCSKNLTNIKDRGVHQRNRALEHIEHHHLDGIVYFADDDNIYSLELFESMREISRFGTWPVAMLAKSKNKAVLEGPVCNGSHVIGWHTNEKSKKLRRFHVDMSGFAFNSTILWDPKRWRKPTALTRQLDIVKEGFQETTFIQQVVEDESQMEGIPLGCSKILNWHLHLEARELGYPRGWLLQKNLDAVLPV